MKIGYACTPLKINNRTTRTFTLKNYSEENLVNCIDLNLKDLIKILEYNISKSILLFRISSDIIPFGSHTINNFNWSKYFKDDLNKIGKLIKDNSIRVSMHPGQYTVINSINPHTVSKSIMDLNYHCLFLDSLNLDSSSKIILHIGGIYKNKTTAINNFICNYNSLSNNVKNRLVIENDEKNYGINDLLYISEKCSIPIIYDNLHYTCYERLPSNNYSILNLINHTWKEEDGIVKVHFSEQNKLKKKGSHSQTINCSGFLDYIHSIKDLNIDIMTEVKDKDFSAIKCINSLKELNNSLPLNDKSSELLSYKYYLKEKGNNIFERAEDILNNKGLIEFYKFIDPFIYKIPNDKSYIKTLKNVYFDLENFLNSSEKNHFSKLFKAEKFTQCKSYLHKIILKKDIKDMISMYYFYN
ncbi:UV DNA damage repair endonuclease UvsE [Eubacterium multiforme]|uniref:UV DNA damage endonuclease n=1 Tax=Eubacterium multiforme TaxID=83339 RepID=A0ABT9UTN9_9FIRM|nr:UV DNA damage repair endonuclease UvsE [Eubacterium multiforme]MDQ0149698.1 UV DNA damage endonuclease [Eubacterium multiforme]